MNKIEITLEALKQQRNQALDAVAFLNGEVAERDAMIENLKTQSDNLQRLIDQMEKNKLVDLPG